MGNIERWLNVPEDFTKQTRLAMLENIVRICTERGASNAEIYEAVGHALGHDQLREAVEAADALLAAYDQSGLTDLRWFVPHMEALRAAIHPGGQ